jgi:pimeloyl-ACP methyl ester carboxylesterase
MLPAPNFIATCKAPEPHFEDYDLPGTRLHTVRCGEGPPLIIVPATVSLIRQWLPLAQFMGLRFTAHFFELPGHGRSTPYPEKFKSEFVPATVEALANKLGYERFNLMGFSFGGLLALRTLEHLQDRIDRVILLSPCVSQRALRFSSPHKSAFRMAARAMKHSSVQKGMYKLMNTSALEGALILALSKFMNVNPSILRSKNALQIPASTLDVLAYTVEEIFTMDYRPARPQFDLPCYFGMSVYDDLLSYDHTERFVRDHFPDLTMRQFTLPYHQPPRPPTFEWLLQEFEPLLEILEI